MVVNLAVLIYLLLGAMRDTPVSGSRRSWWRSAAAQARGAGEPLGAREAQTAQVDLAPPAQTGPGAATPPSAQTAADAPPAQGKP